MSEVIVKLTGDHIRVKGGEYVRDLVRCKECKHWHKKGDLTYCDRIDYGYGYKPDDFCSYGERRE